MYLEKPTKDATVTGSIRTMNVSDLMEGDTLVDVEYSCLNYKDGKALAGQPGVVRAYPFIPGIDFAGTVVNTDSDK